LAALRLIVGLGNPGAKYAATRHNVGADWVERIAAQNGIRLDESARFKGSVGRGDIAGHDVRLLVPSTYVNASGESVGAVAGFFKIEATEVLVAYDEVAFAPGVTRLKIGGGHNGHNGIKSVIASLGNDAGFARLRIGVGHPGDARRMVAYLTSVSIPAGERNLIEDSCAMDATLLAHVVGGEFGQAMNLLHARSNETSD